MPSRTNYVGLIDFDLSNYLKMRLVSVGTLIRNQCRTLIKTFLRYFFSSERTWIKTPPHFCFNYLISFRLHITKGPIYVRWLFLYKTLRKCTNWLSSSKKVTFIHVLYTNLDYSVHCECGGFPRSPIFYICISLRYKFLELNDSRLKCPSV